MAKTDIFQFDKNIPPELLPRIKALVIPLVKLIPKWCQVVIVEYCTNPKEHEMSDGTAAAMGTDYEYRRGVLSFYPDFFTESQESQEEICIHEFCHLSISVLSNYAKAELKRLLPNDENPKYRESVVQELNTRLESTTQDMCWIIRGLMNG